MIKDVLNKIDCEKILKEALSKGGEFAEIFLERKQNTSIIMEDNKVEEVLGGFEQGVGIRVISDYKTLYAFSNVITEKNLFEIASKIKEAVRAGKSFISLDFEKKIMNGKGYIQASRNSKYF